jgi:hypothetical protein
VGRQFGTAGNENAPGLAVDAEGAVTVGRCCGPQGLETGGDPLADAFARKYDADGNVLWAMQFGTSVFDNAQDVALKGRDVYIVGTTRGSFPGYVNAGAERRVAAEQEIVTPGVCLDVDPVTN